MLKRVEDVIFSETCMFLDQEKRGCTIYHARPGVCREYPDRARCSYYDLLQFERRQQDDETVVPLVQITFREVTEGDRSRRQVREGLGVGAEREVMSDK